nr:MAG TPA: hypothetical protein [Bacteriophage sp.]
MSCALVLTEIFRPDHTSNSLGELSVNIIPQFVQKKKRQTRKPAAFFESPEQKLKTNS